MGTHHATFGVYRTGEQTEKVLSILRTRGFGPSSVRVLYPNKRGWQDFAYELRTMIGFGAVIGASIGLVVGLLVGVFAFPGLNFIIFGAALGCFFGAMSGALVGIGVPEAADQRYLEYLDDGGILLSVHVNDQDEAKRALEILESTGAEDVTSANESRMWQTVFRQRWKLRAQSFFSVK